MTPLPGRYVEEAAVRGRAECIGIALQAKNAAAAIGWPTRRAHELGLVCVELANNAVRHAGGGSCQIEIDCERAELTITDNGPGFPAWVLSLHASGRPIEEGRPMGSATLGAGLDCAKRFSEQLVLENPARGGARVRATCRSTIRRG